ncbi:organic cation transporter protein-like [Amphiura filiformis]|uniref:organic cation transporter protein-like n=1 Tax=Amphiura filiformis TaxID=82378 RepID=UPI003B212368
MKEYNFDVLLSHLGEFGRYQRRVYYLVCLMTLVGTWHTLVQVFLAGTTDHWCHVPEIQSSDCQEWNLTDAKCQEVTKDIGIPAIGDVTDVDQYAQCERYNLTDVEVYPGIDLSNSTQTIPCNSGWVYGTSQYKSTIISDFNLVCDESSFSNLAQSIFFAGVLCGDILFGAIADRVGRRHTLLVALVIQLTAGIATVFSPNYLTFVILRFLIACATGGIMILSLVIGTEFVGPSKRIVVCVLNYMFSTLGSMSLALLAFLIRKWRILQLVVSAPSLILCFFIIIIPESARWLISRGRLKEADEIIQRVARANKVEIPESLLEGYKEINEDKKQEEVEAVGSSDPWLLDLLLYPNMRWRLLCLMWMGFVNSMVYYGLSLNSTNFGFNEYLDFFLVVSADIIGILLCYYTVEKWGRVITVCVSMILGGALCIVTGWMVAGVARVIVASLGKVGIAASFAVALFLPIEIFPTPVRSISTGVVGMACGIGSVLSPLLLILADIWSPLPLVVFGSLSISAGFVALFLPETMGRNLPETMQEGEALGARRRTGCRGSYGSLIDNCRSHEDEEIA